MISVSPGALGAFGANQSVRQCLVFLNVPAMQQPEAYLGGAVNLFDTGGKLKVDSTRDFLPKIMEAFAAQIETIRKNLQRSLGDARRASPNGGSEDANS